MTQKTFNIALWFVVMVICIACWVAVVTAIRDSKECQARGGQLVRGVCIDRKVIL